MTKKIAIIEDDSAIAEMYKLKLTLNGYNVELASNGEEGFNLAKKFKPDVILLDLMMPVMSGEEMLTKLRKTDWGSKINVIILTNISKDEAPKNLQFLNIKRYIVKAHHTPSQILEIIDRLD